MTARGPATGLGIVMTDLFISASAALLMVIAVLRTTPPIPVPIQADIVATCPPAAILSAREPVMSMRPGGREGATIKVGGPGDLASLPADLGLRPRLFYSIGVIAGEGAPLSAACLRWAQDSLVRTYNRKIDELTRRGTARPIFGIVPGRAPNVRGGG